ncbi:5724_t:CDS:2, partial [Diversispora eburnea]
MHHGRLRGKEWNEQMRIIPFKEVARHIEIKFLHTGYKIMAQNNLTTHGQGKAHFDIGNNKLADKLMGEGHTHPIEEPLKRFTKKL